MEIKELLIADAGAITGLSQWQAKREDIVGRLYDTIGTPPVPRNTRDIEMLGAEELPDYTRHKLRYRVGDGDIVTAYLMVPSHLALPLPAVVAMHQTVGAGKDEVAGLAGHRDYAYGHELAMQGYVVLAPDYLTAGERVHPGEAPFESGPFYARYPDWSMVGKNMEDSFAAIDVLHTLDVVDKDRVGVIGHSHGGHNAIFAMALDDRIKVGVSNCGMSVFSEEEERMEWTLEDGYIYLPALRSYFLEDREPPFDIHEVAALIAPRPWLNISSYVDMAFGRQEFLAPVGAMLYRVYELYEQQPAFSYFMHGNNHSFPGYARALAYAWLDRFLYPGSGG